MVCSAAGGEAETLWCLSRVLPGAGFSEVHTLLPLDGPAWALTPLPSLHAAHLSQALVSKKGELKSFQCFKDKNILLAGWFHMKGR